MDRVHRLFLAIVPLGIILMPATLSATETDLRASRLKRLSTSQLETRILEVNRRLESLARPSMRSGVGAIGFRSRVHTESANTEWIEIQLAEETTIDQIVLVPMIWRDTKIGFRADGFPLEFRILAGTADDSNGRVIASYGAQDRLLPRVAPVVVSCAETTASWVRLEATLLSPRAWDGKFLLQLSEILVFSGQDNVALRRRLEVSSTDPWEFASQNKQCLVDGFVPYLMDAAEGRQSLACVSPIGVGDHPSLTIDLGVSQRLDQIAVHATDVSDNVPQLTTSDFGIPRHFIVEGANQSDFADAVALVEYRMKTIFDVGPIIFRRCKETSCRFVRLVAIEPFIETQGADTGSRIGFAEIELFSNGRNVAIGKTVTANFEPDSPERSLAALTDGNNLYGKILPLKDWLGELSERHELETERPLAIAELNDRYQQQRVNSNRLIWLACLLAFAAVCAVLVQRIIQQRAVYRTRERIAADLHDEIGANIHAIGLLGDLSQAASDSPEKLKSLLGSMRELTRRTGTAARYCADLLESKGLYDDIEQEMRRSATRIMADLEHEISIEGEDILGRLKPRARIDLYLFYKECLINIIRHSGATRAATRLFAEGREVCMTVTDNGRGVASSSGNGVPESLRRRARLLGARVFVEHPGDGGTCVILKLRIKKSGVTP